MSKQKRGLPWKIVAAVNTGEIQEPLSTKDIRSLVNRRGWKAADTYMNSLLYNCANETYSAKYPKCFVQVAPGKFEVKPEFKGHNWR